MRNVSEIQAFLLNHDPPFDIGPWGADGKLGFDTLKAINLFLQSKGKPPIVGRPTLIEINTAMFPEEQPAPKPRRNTLAGAIILHFLTSTLKGLPIMTMLSGYKTYILAVLILGSSAAETFIPGFDLPGYSMGLGEAVMVALALITGRSGATADVNKALGK